MFSVTLFTGDIMAHKITKEELKQAKANTQNKY